MPQFIGTNQYRKRPLRISPDPIGDLHGCRTWPVLILLAAYEQFVDDAPKFAKKG